MTFRVVRTNHYNQDLGLIHSTNGNHLESPKEGSSIDHQLFNRACGKFKAGAVLCNCRSALSQAPGSDQFHEKIGTSTVGGCRLLIWSTTGFSIPSSVCTRKHDEDFTDGISSSRRSDQVRRRRRAAAAAGDNGKEAAAA
ncbi:hypothetical protein F511_36114 [Dorcoceras hygrometricum]|uniref:Uncharacterized protein n=1 Tax=Dorcoceras hygrometricum TaxID=472368 RepID=A0A2Z7C0P8_9LAMI|nr:hypothetical protein F511_36114 [Dorcoceras hygrometricum]